MTKALDADKRSIITLRAARWTLSVALAGSMSLVASTQALAAPPTAAPKIQVPSSAPSPAPAPIEVGPGPLPPAEPEPSPELIPAASPPPIPPPPPMNPPPPPAPKVSASPSTPEPQPEPPGPPRGAQIGGGLAIGGAVFALFGTAIGLVGGIGWAWAENCNLLCPAGDGAKGKSLFILGGTMGGVGLTTGIAGLVVRQKALNKHSLRLAPVVGPRMTGLGISARF